MSTPSPRRFHVPPLVAVAVLGFTSGLPLVLTGGTLQAWMKTVGVDLKVIGVFALVGLPYTLKFLWSPLLDRFRLPWGGRRRGWISAMVGALMVSLFLISRANPQHHLWWLAGLAITVAFFSASTDIVIDAYRTELVPGPLQGQALSLHITGYRLGMLVSGALAMWLSDRIPWRTVYCLMSLCLVPGIVIALLAPEPQASPQPRTLQEAVVGPFLNFLRRRGALEVLAFIFLFKLGDGLTTALSVPFLMELGFTRSEIGLANKVVGMCSLIVGALVGGWLMRRWSLLKALWIFGLLQMVSISASVALAYVGKQHLLMLITIALENSIFGMGSVAYLAMIARLCDTRCTATQFALLTSLSALTRVLFATPAGWMAQRLGWTGYFLACMVCAVPGLLLLFRFHFWELPEAMPSHEG